MLRKSYHFIKCRPQKVFRLEMASQWLGLASHEQRHTEHFSHTEKKVLFMVTIKLTHRFAPIWIILNFRSLAFSNMGWRLKLQMCLHEKSCDQTLTRNCWGTPALRGRGLCRDRQTSGPRGPGRPHRGAHSELAPHYHPPDAQARWPPRHHFSLFFLAQWLFFFLGKESFVRMACLGMTTLDVKYKEFPL